MPPVCRAEPGGHDPHELVASALDAFVDAAVRAALPRIDLLPPRRGRPKRRPAVEAWLTALTGPDGRFDADPMNSTRWPRRCGRGTRSAPAARPGAGDVPAPETEPTTARRRRARRGGWSSCCSPRPTRACWSPPSRSGTTTAACAGGSTDRRSCCSPSSAGPAGSSRSSRPPCAPRARRSSTLDADGAHRFLSAPAAVLDEAGFGVQLPSWWDRRRARARALRAHPGRRRGEQGRLRPRPAGRFPLGAGRRRRDAQRGGDRRARRGQGAAGPAARPVGGVDPEQLRRGLEFLARSRAGRTTAAEVLALAASHPDDCRHPAAGHRGARDGLARRPARRGRRHSRCGRSSRRTDFTRRCAPTSSAGCRGWRSCPRWGWAAAWPTTWAWARPCSCWRWRPCSDTRSQRRPDAAAVPDVAGRQLAAGGGEVRPRPAGVRPPRPGAAARRRAA